MDEQIIQILPSSGRWWAEFELKDKLRRIPIALWALMKDSNGFIWVEGLCPANEVSLTFCSELPKFKGYYTD